MGFKAHRGVAGKEGDMQAILSIPQKRARAGAITKDTVSHVVTLRRAHFIDESSESQPLGVVMLL